MLWTCLAVAIGLAILVAGILVAGVFALLAAAMSAISD